MKALKSLVPYLLIAVLMWLLWLCNTNGNRLIFISEIGRASCRERV